MKLKYLLIIPYFGQFPSTFKLWLDSIEKNSQFNWFLITDNYLEYVPKNMFYLKYNKFDEFVIEVNSILGFNTRMSDPYKLCDLRPAYGYLFEFLLKKISVSEHFDYWGYTDMDVIYGNLNRFIRDEIMQEVDVFQVWGHFTLIRNSASLASLFLKRINKWSFRKIITRQYNLIFDESVWITLLEQEGARIFSSANIVADILPGKFEFTIGSYKGERQIFTYEDGFVYRYFFHGSNIVR